MSQKLILPLNKTQVLCGYKNAAYQAAWGRPHYGQDHWSKVDKTVWALGNGEVAAAGMDNVYGGTAVVVYKDVQIHDGSIMDLVARCYHMSTVYVKAGQKVNKDTKIGIMGNTGQYTSGEHLHIEFDTDTKWPTYTIELKGDSNIMKKGALPDTTLDPADVLYVKESAPDNQTVEANADYYRRKFVFDRDFDFPKYDDNSDSNVDNEAETIDYKKLYESMKKDLEDILKKYS